MAYGIIKIDTITFTDGGIDKSVAISGLVQNPTFTGNITATGTISGDIVRGQTISGVIITGTTAQFASGTFVSLTGTTLQGTTATYTTGSFTSLTGTTTSGTTANFVSGVFSTQISGVTVTGTTANFTSGNFTNISGGTHTITSGVFALGTAANPSISFTSDPNTGIYSPGADQVAISTNGTGRLFVDASGNVGVGASPSVALDVFRTSDTSVQLLRAGANNVANTSLARVNLSVTATGGISLLSEGFGAAAGADFLVFGTANTERMRIDSSGRLLVGTSTARSNFFNSTTTPFDSARLQVEGTTYEDAAASLVCNSSTAGVHPIFVLAKSNGDSLGSNTLVSSSTILGMVSFQGSDGSEFVAAANITAEVDGTPGTNDMPGRLVFSTNPGSPASSPTERMRINSSGQVMVGNSSARGLITASSNTGTTNFVTLTGSASGSVANGGTLEIANFFSSVTTLYSGMLTVTITGSANTNNVTRMYAIRRVSNGGANDQSTVTALTSASAATGGQGGNMTDVVLTITGSNVENITATITTSVTETKTFHAVFEGMAC